MTKDTTMPAKSDTSDTSRDKMNSEPEGYPNLPSEVHAAGSVLLQGSGRKRVSRAERKGVDSPFKAIRKKCRECMGCDPDGVAGASLIRDCTATDCPLHALRFGKYPKNKAAVLRDRERCNRLKHVEVGSEEESAINSEYEV